MFGSVAAGSAGPQSDLDIALDLGKPMNTATRIEFISSLASLTGRPVDLLDLRTLGEPLLGQVLQNGRRLVGSNTDFGRLIARHLTDTEDMLPLHRRLLAERRQTWIGT